MVSLIYSGVAMLIGAVLGYAVLYLLARSMRFDLHELNHFLIISCVTIVVFVGYYLTKASLGLASHEEMKTTVDILSLIIDSTLIYFTSGLLWELYVSKQH